MVSQSTNLMANSALEAWVRRNASFKRKNLLLLSSSCIDSGGHNIKACFLTETGSPPLNHEYNEQAELVFGSLPKGAVLSKLPVVTVGEDDGSVLISVPLDNPKEGDVVCTLQTIADNMLTKGMDISSSNRISLVRPDGGWFPGIEEIQQDMELSFKEIDAIKNDKNRAEARRRRIEITPRHNSYGSYF